MLFKDYPDVMNFNQFRRALGLGKSKAYSLLQTNQIQHFTIGSRYKIPKLCIIDYIKKRIFKKQQESQL